MSFFLGFTKLDYPLMNHKQFHTSLQLSQKKSMAKKDTDSLFTHSDNSTSSTMQIQTRSGKNSEVDYTGRNDENDDDDDDEVIYFCKLCDYSESKLDAFVGHYSRAHKKIFLYAELHHVLNGTTLQLAYANIARITILRYSHVIHAV